MDLLYKIFEYIKKHKIKSIIYVLISVAVIPFLVHCAFYFDAPWTFLIAGWSAGDLLGYYAAILAAAGTVFLGVVAIEQNRQIHLYEKRRREDEDERIRKAFMPVIDCLEIKFVDKDYVRTLSDERHPPSQMQYVKFTVSNYHLNDAKGLMIIPNKLENISDKKEEELYMAQQADCLAGKTIEVTFPNAINVNKSYKLSGNIIFRDDSTYRNMYEIFFTASYDSSSYPIWTSRIMKQKQLIPGKSNRAD